MRRLRTRLMISTGAVTVLTGVGVALAAHPAGATTIVINPIIQHLINFVLSIPL